MADLNIKPKGLSTLDKFKLLSTTRRLEQMKNDLNNDRYIFDGIALAGQITLIYSKPNAGKTLLFFRMLIDSIKDGRVDAEKVFYINADDHFKGLVTKTEIAAEYGFEMISPAESGIDPNKIISMLSEMAQSGEARGLVIILDTLKKFANMMSKESQSALYKTLRRLIAKDATVILAGHANKYPDSEGKLVYEGTSDTMNDIDCAYVINLTSLPEGDVTVEFVREKNRGDNIFKANYSYKKHKGMTYQEMLDSVKKVDGEHVGNKPDINILLDKFESEILLITGFLERDKLNQSAIIKAFNDMGGEGLASECSVRKLKECLRLFNGKLWRAHRADKKEKTFSLISTSTDYAKAKSGG